MLIKNLYTHENNKMITLATLFLLILERKNYNKFKKFYWSIVILAMFYDGFIISKYLIEQNLLEKYGKFFS